MPLYQDQLGRFIHLSHSPKRIISLVPSQTELLHYLNLEEEVVGITKFCIHPEHWFKSKTRVGGTKNLNLDKIKSLQPDLIIANKEENTKEQIEELAENYPVWISDVNNVQDASTMITHIGNITGKKEAADDLAKEIVERFNHLQQTLLPHYPTCYFIWKEPFMTVGGDTFIHDIMSKAGFDNVYKERSRYPVVSVDELLAQSCDIVLLSSEPYPFREKHINEMAELFRSADKPIPKIILADGELFSWYGSRLLHTPAYIKKLHQQINAL
ncbi:MAG: ABC transporter substrate-binding protein [Flavisolibacter sp.]|nr:ABC transporter substrate-binding protein [Flavisolibacter sp.]